MVAEAKKQFNIYLPEGLIRRVKHAAVDANQSLSVFVERLLEEQLRELEGREKP